MSNPQFIEETSSDPTERAIARRVTRILNDRSLTREQRQTLVRRAQHELLAHRRSTTSHKVLLEYAAKVSVPAGYTARCAQVKDGRVQLAVFKPSGAFMWLDAGAAPAGVSAHTGVVAIEPRRTLEALFRQEERKLPA